MRDQFKFKQFSIHHGNSSMKVGTDAVLLGSWVKVDNDLSILDIGTGCGVIALMMAQRNKNAKVVGIEPDPNSVKEAIENVSKSPWSDRVAIHKTTLQNFQTSDRYDQIVSNPPYFDNGTQSPLAGRSRARHTRQLNFKELFHYSNQLLKERGTLSLVLPALALKDIKHQAAEHSFSLIRKMEFYSRARNPMERVLLTFSKVNSECAEEILIHYDDGNNWSADYIELTKDFYLKL